MFVDQRLRFLFGEAKWVWGETRLHEKVRYKTESTGPGGMYARWLHTLPDKIEPTGDDALYAQITFQSTGFVAVVAMERNSLLSWRHRRATRTVEELRFRNKLALREMNHCGKRNEMHGLVWQAGVRRKGVA